MLYFISNILLVFVCFWYFRCYGFALQCGVLLDKYFQFQWDYCCYITKKKFLQLINAAKVKELLLKRFPYENAIFIIQLTLQS